MKYAKQHRDLVKKAVDEAIGKETSMTMKNKQLIEACFKVLNESAGINLDPEESYRIDDVGDDILDAWREAPMNKKFSIEVTYGKKSVTINLPAFNAEKKNFLNNEDDMDYYVKRDFIVDELKSIGVGGKVSADGDDNAVIEKAYKLLLKYRRAMDQLKNVNIPDPKNKKKHAIKEMEKAFKELVKSHDQYLEFVNANKKNLKVV